MNGFISIISSTAHWRDSPEVIWYVTGYHGSDGWRLVSMTRDYAAPVPATVELVQKHIAKLRQELGTDARVVVIGETKRLSDQFEETVYPSITTILDQVQTKIPGDVEILRSGNSLGVVTTHSMLQEMMTYDPEKCKKVWVPSPYYTTDAFGLQTYPLSYYHVRLLMYHGNRYTTATKHAMLPQVMSAAELRMVSGVHGTMTRIGAACAQAARDGKTSFAFAIDAAVHDEVVRRMTELGYTVTTREGTTTFDAAAPTS